MFLREVVISGFKSFADRTRIAMQPGVTAIVGPNGCGKSNIVDAIRWVLGEQSAKALRGGKMEDVIFAGTDRRKPLPMCEVSLTFTDCEKELGTAFNEVEIARRVGRDGAGEYFINGKQCRLKDVHHLFMDTGVGRASYSFMMQGQIDQVLSSNPAERRAIFEEAAGITRYKSSRREAMNKLALVEQNLARTTDVIEEVARQIGSLKRQASKALRHQRLMRRLERLDLAHNTFFFARRQEEITRLEGLAAGLRDATTQLSGALRGREERVAALKIERSAIHEKLQESQQAVFDLRSEKESAESQASFAGVRREDLQGRLEGMERETGGLRGQLVEIERRLEADAEHHRGAQGQVGSIDEIFRARQGEFDAALTGLQQAEHMLHEARQSLLMLESGITRLRSNSTHLEVDLKTYQVRHAALADTLSQLKEERAQLEMRRSEFTATAQTRASDLAAARQEVTDAQASEAVMRQKFRDAQTQMQEFDRDIARGAARLQALEGLQARYEGFSEGAKAILQGKLGELLPKGSYHILTKTVEIEEGAGAALEALLGPAADALALADGASTAAIASRLAEGKLGRACLLAPAPARASSSIPTDLPAGVRPALTAVKMREGHESLRTGLENLLGGCYLAESLDVFLQFWSRHPEFEFLLAATPLGEVVDRRGLIFGGGSSGAKPEGSFLQRESEIRKLRKELGEKNEKLTTVADETMRVQAGIEEAENLVAQKRARSAEIAEEAAAVQAQESAVAQSLAQSDETSEKQRRQFEQLEQSRTEAGQRLERAQADLAKAEGEISQQRAQIAETEAKLVSLRTERDRRQEVLSEARLQLAEKRQHLQTLDRGLGELQTRGSELNSNLQRRAQEMDTTREQMAELEQTATEQRKRAAQIETSLSSALASLETDRQAGQRLDSALKEIDDGMAGERSGLERMQSELHGYEVKLAEERSQSSFLEEKVRAEHQKDVRTVDWKSEFWQADEPPPSRVRLDDLEEEGETPVRRARPDPTPEDLAKLDSTDWDAVVLEIKDLRERLAGLGPVNLVAIEEYAALKERHDFIKTQSEDLWKSKDELVKAIDEINQTSQQLFQETFEQIRKNYRFTFERLFGGGEADLQLVQTEDVLDSGVEIVARPPGSRLRAISLLSGGQKALAALSLLFGIYMVKPSPFCVLDELDAPLDDANVGRFTALLRDFTKHSQFLVITHSKRTIASANTIYGVTMPERGVTKLISMRLDHTGEAVEHTGTPQTASATSPAPASPPAPIATADPMTAASEV